MSLFSSIFAKKESSASVARDRLKLVLAHERASNALPYMEEMKQEIMEVIKKYTKVKDIHISSQSNQNIDVLEMEIILK
ncbi:MAG TPA: cell division topological specificity factor MinE [Sulfurimonas sp.]|nr:cell division topological specificity factor MinE [Sulfurimonas sp.]